MGAMRGTVGLGTAGRWLALLATLMLASACAQEPVPQDNFYRIAAPPAAAGGAALDGVLEVQRLAADGLSGNRPIVYSRDATPMQLNEYHYHFWVESPPVMVQDRIVAFARASGLADTVVTPEMRIEPDFILTGRIHRFEQVLGATPRAEIRLELGVRAGGGDRILLLKTYERGEPAADDSVRAVVVAFDAAFAGIMRDFAADLRAR